MYDIIARRRLSTVLRYIFDFLPKEETSIHLNTKKAVLSDRRNSDTEPYIMLNIFFVEDISSPRCGGRQIKTPYTVRLLSSRSPANFVSPSALFSHLSVSAFLLHHRMRFKTLQCRHGSVTAADNQGAVHCPAFIFRFPANFVSPSALFSPFGFRFLPRHRMRFKTLQCRHGSVTAADNQGAVHCSAFIFRSPANRVSPSALFSPFGFRFLPRHRMRFKTLQYCPSSVAAADKSRRRTLSGICLPVPGT